MGKNNDQNEETKDLQEMTSEVNDIPEEQDNSQDVKKPNFLSKIFNKENAIRAGFFGLGVVAKIGFDMLTGGNAELPSIDAPALPDVTTDVANN